MPDLTPRQREIKERLEKQMSALEIAEDLEISRNAVYQQIQSLRKKGALPRGYTPSGQAPREALGALALRDDGSEAARLESLLTHVADELEQFAATIRQHVSR